MGQVTKVQLSCYLVLLSCDSKPGNKTATPLSCLWPGSYIQQNLHNETQKVLIKTQKFHYLPGTVFTKSCLSSLSWETKKNDGCFIQVSLCKWIQPLFWFIGTWHCLLSKGLQLFASSWPGILSKLCPVHFRRATGKTHKSCNIYLFVSWQICLNVKKLSPNGHFF